MRTLILTLWLSAASLGWVAPRAHAAGSILTSDPSGVQLAVLGPVELYGKTPLDLQELPEGEYRFFVQEPGFPAARGRIARDESGFVQRSWAGPRALLLPPGTVHLERGERRGLIYLGAATASLSMGLIWQGRLDDAAQSRDSAGRLYEKAQSEDAIDSARLALAQAEDEETDAKEVRGLWFAYLGTTAAMSFVEAALMTPGTDLRVSEQGDYSIRLPASHRGLHALRSALVPGAGQRYMGRQGAANLFTFAVGAFAAASVLAQDSFLEQRREQADAQRRLQLADTESEVRSALANLQQEEKETDQASNVRWGVVGALGAAYLWNVIDAATSRSTPSRSPVDLSVKTEGADVRLSASWRMQ